MPASKKTAEPETVETDTVETDPRIAQIASLVLEYNAQTSTGFRAAKMKSIHALEDALFLDGIEITPFKVPGKSATVDPTTLSDDDLKTRWTQTCAARLADGRKGKDGAGERAAQSRNISAYETEMTARKMTFAPFALPGKTADPNASLSPEDLSNRVHALRHAYARAASGSDRSRTVRFEKMLRAAQDLASVRGVAVSGTDPLAVVAADDDDTGSEDATDTE